MHEKYEKLEKKYKALEVKYMQLTKDLSSVKSENERIIFSLHHEFRAIWASLKGLYLISKHPLYQDMWLKTFDRAEKFLDKLAEEYITSEINKKL